MELRRNSRILFYMIITKHKKINHSLKYYQERGYATKAIVLHKNVPGK